jgi:anti-sigma-K factor RskA
MSAHDLLPLYAVDSLPDDEREAFEAHLETCDQCLEELASYEPAVTRLAAEVSLAPRPALKANVMAMIQDVPQDGMVTPSTVPEQTTEQTTERVAEPVVPRQPMARRSSNWFALAAAFLALALLAVSGGGLALWRETRDLQQQVAEANELASILTADDAELVDVDTDLSGNLRVAVAPSRNAGVVLADNLEGPGQGRDFQLWTIENGQPRSAGLVAQRSGVLGGVIDLTNAEAVAMSIEPEGGSEQPTEVVAVAELG